MSSKTVSRLPEGYNPLSMLKKFLHYEAAGGIVLLIFAALAMVVANSPLAPLYHHVLHEVKLTILIGNFGLDKDIIHWINDGLMAIFFFLVGLEIKREMLEGNLSSVKQAMLPAVAAAGGMAAPGLVFFYLNQGNADAIAGWAIPTATDIAFAVGILSLLGKRVPLSIKVFLLALAIFDDLGAIIVIALFYTSDLNPSILLWAAGFVAALIGMNRMKINSGTAYLIVGIALWFCVLKSGVHATLAGVITALAIPLQLPNERRSLLRQLEHDLHPIVAFIIVPVFAFANAGVSLEGLTMDVAWEPVTLGVVLGLFVGKQIGIVGSTWLAVKSGLAKLPHGATWLQVWGMSMLAGIGFTMSLFITSLAYRAQPLLQTEAKLGILMGSALSAILGMMVMVAACRKPADQEHT